MRRRTREGNELLEGRGTSGNELNEFERVRVPDSWFLIHYFSQELAGRNEMSTGVARRRDTIVSSDSEEDSSDFSQARYPSLADSGSRQPLKGTRNTNYSFGRHHHHSSSSKHSPSDSIVRAFSPSLVFFLSF